MKKIIVLLLVFLGSLCLSIGAPVFAGFGDFMKSVEKVLGGGGGLSEDKIVQGLKEALEIGTKNAVGNVSQTDGYYGNPIIRILLPEKVKKVEGLLRTVGYGSQLDAFELSMNRAAEKAAPEAKEMFWETIRGMSFDDARKILKGRENEATLYFKEKTWNRLSETFKPIVRETMGTVGPLWA